MPQDRLTRLEETAAHLARLVEELSDVIARQDAEIRTLSRKVDLLTEREAERAMDAGGGVFIAGERPPHW
jgi:SlyX protein